MKKLLQSRLSVEIVDHCNLACACCDHLAPWLRPAFVDTRSFRKDLLSLREVMHVGELRITGGEPLLHPALVDLVDIARESNVGRRLTLLTNGVMLHRVKERLLKRLDSVVVTLYPGVRYRFDAKNLSDVARRCDCLLKFRVVRRFGEVFLDKPNLDPLLVGYIFSRCSSSRRCHTIYRGRYYRCSRAHRIPFRLKATSRTVIDSTADGVDLHGKDARILGRELAAYVAEDRPLYSCRFCLGSSGRRRPCRQLSRQEIEREMDGNACDVLSLVDLTDEPESRFCLRSEAGRNRG
jgi:hypothetical protein